MNYYRNFSDWFRAVLRLEKIIYKSEKDSVDYTHAAFIHLNVFDDNMGNFTKPFELRIQPSTITEGITFGKRTDNYISFSESGFVTIYIKEEDIRIYGNIRYARYKENELRLIVISREDYHVHHIFIGSKMDIDSQIHYPEFYYAG